MCQAEVFKGFREGFSGFCVPSHQLEIEHETMGEERRDEREG